MWEDYTGDGNLDFVIAGETNTAGQILTKLYKQQTTAVITGNLTQNNISNYPNPLNPTTTISFSIPDNGKIELSIYNIKGQKVKSLVKETIPAGDHNILWNGTDDNNKPVSSGVYFYKLIVNGKTEAVKKCLLLK
jgi:flagellar hook assembly protein FlgD